MECYCYETESSFIFCVEDVTPEYAINLKHAWFQKSGNKYIKEYTFDDGNSEALAQDKNILRENFSRLAPKMFEGIFDWQESLLRIAKKFTENNIEWYIIGSVSELTRGVKISPSDIDIIVHTKDFYKVKEVFQDNIIEPFIDNKGTWVVRYFGRLCIENAMIDIAADHKMNKENHVYDRIEWNGFNIHIEPLEDRYRVELQRNRKERIQAIEDFKNLQNEI